MIVQESDALFAALDRRLQVDRVATVTAVAAEPRPSDDRARAPTLAAVPQATSSPDGLPASLAARLPLGQVVVARVVAVPAPGRVVAEVDTLQIDMAWPASTSVMPRAGQDVRLRVLAHRPMLLLESADSLDAGEPVTGRSPDDVDAPHWSSDARSLQAADATTDHRTGPSGPVRFDAPILLIEIESQPDPRFQSAPHDDAATGVATNDAKRTAMPVADAHATIPIDDVIVGRATARVDGIEAPLIPRASPEPTATSAPFTALVLAGPAWPGQPVEFVVRRERADEQLDNPVLDQWCGEVVIDLPRLGRVAGHLAFSMQGLRIRLEADDAATVATMTAASVSLANALSADALRVSALSVGLPAGSASRSPDA